MEVIVIVGAVACPCNHLVKFGAHYKKAGGSNDRVSNAGYCRMQMISRRLQSMICLRDLLKDDPYPLCGWGPCTRFSSLGIRRNRRMLTQCKYETTCKTAT